MKGAYSMLLEQWNRRTHRSFTAKIAKNAKNIAKDVA